MNAEYQYLVGKLQDVLATNPRVNLLDVNMNVCGGKIYLTGESLTEERRTAVATVVSEIAPDVEVRNEIIFFQLQQIAEPEAIHA